MKSVICTICRRKIPKPGRESFGLGFGIDKRGRRYCYACCAELDKVQMHEDGCIDLYLTKTAVLYEAINWPGTLRLPCSSVSFSVTNLRCKRTDVCFVFEGFVWHGVNVGGNKILHCKRTKRKAANAISDKIVKEGPEDDVKG